MAENNTSLTPIVKDVSDQVMGRIADMVDKQELKLPDGYNAGTALRSAMLILQETKDKSGQSSLQVCTKASVVNALLNMCIQGLMPAKKQCYFITYGNQMQLFVSYFGIQCALRRAVPSVQKIVTDFIKEGDQVEWATNQYGERYVARVVTDPLVNYNKPRRFGFCNIYDGMGNLLAATLMSWAEIEISWKQSKTYGNNDSPHKKFPEEMAKRTLINRACKNLLNSSIESDPIIAAAINQTNDAEYERVEVGASESPKPEKKSFKDRYQIGKKPEAEPQPEPASEPEPEPQPQPQPSYDGPGPEDFDDEDPFNDDSQPYDAGDDIEF